MFRRMTFWFSGGRGTDGKSDGGSISRVHHHGPDEKKRKKRIAVNRDKSEGETSTSLNDNTTTVLQEMVEEVEIIYSFGSGS